MSDAHSTVVWKEVPGFLGYRASTEGNVETQWIDGKKHPLAFNKGKPYRGSAWKPVKTSTHRDGYLQFNVPAEATENRKRAAYRVHYFVCLAFHGVPITGHEVRHFPDPNPVNNRPDNLVWGTHLQNLKDMETQGTRAKGTTISHAKLTEAIVIEIWQLKERGWTNMSIARKFGVTQPVVCSIFKGRAWKHVKPLQTSDGVTS